MTTRWVPFTAYLKVFPSPGNRTETVRSLQRISNLIYEELIDNDELSIANPGGGQHRSYSGYQKGGFSGMVPGGAIKPQFGNTPAQVVVTGFYRVDSESTQPHAELQVISGGEVHTGRSRHLYDSFPPTATNNEAKDLRESIEDSLTSLPSSVDYTFFRLEYAGIIYGDRGIGFPQ